MVVERSIGISASYNARRSTATLTPPLSHRSAMADAAIYQALDSYGLTSFSNLIKPTFMPQGAPELLPLYRNASIPMTLFVPSNDAGASLYFTQGRPFFAHPGVSRDSGQCYFAQHTGCNLLYYYPCVRGVPRCSRQMELRSTFLDARRDENGTLCICTPAC